MSEMKKRADMKPDNASKVFSHVEEIQQLRSFENKISTIALKKPILKIV